MNHEHILWSHFSQIWWVVLQLTKKPAVKSKLEYKWKTRNTCLPVNSSLLKNRLMWYHTVSLFNTPLKQIDWSLIDRQWHWIDTIRANESTSAGSDRSRTLNKPKSVRQENETVNIMTVVVPIWFCHHRANMKYLSSLPLLIIHLAAT